MYDKLSSNSKIERTLVLLAILIFFWLSLQLAGTAKLDVDELYEATLITQPLSELFSNYRVSSQITHVLLTKIIGTICSDVLCLRLGSIIAGTLSVPLIYQVARTLLKHPAAGVFSAILLSLASAHLRYSSFIRGYALMTLLALITILAFVQALQKNRRRWWVIFSIAGVLNIYNQAFSALLVAPILMYLAVWLWLHRDNLLYLRSRLLNILLSGVLSLVLLLPMLTLLLTQQSNTDNLYILFNTEWPSSFPPVTLTQPSTLVTPLWKLAYELAPAGEPHWSTVILIACLSGGLYWGLTRTRSELQSVTTLLSFILFVPPLLLSLAATLFQPWFWAFWRFVLFIIGPYLILAGLGLAILTNKLLRIVHNTQATLFKSAVWGMPLLLILPVIGPAFVDRFTASPPFTNAYEVARSLNAQVTHNDIVICVPDEDWRVTGGREPCSLTLNLYSNLSSRVFYLDQLASYQTLLNFIAANGHCINRYIHLPHPRFTMHCLESPPPEQPPGIWLILWRNRTITANAALTSFPQNFVKDRIGATDLVYLPNDTDIQQNLQKAGKLAVQQSTTPLRRFENYISLAAIHLAVGDINQTFATLDEAAFTSRWPQAIDRLNKISAQISYLSLPLAPKKRINVIWQDKLRLVGTDQQLEESSLQPGDPIQINFYWEALQPLSQPYQFLLQLVDEQNQPVANYDYQPFDGQRPVNDWSAGQVIRQTRTFELPADLSPRTYRLVAGIYHPTTLARLSISDGPPGELITLITWEIE